MPLSVNITYTRQPRPPISADQRISRAAVERGHIAAAPYHRIFTLCPRCPLWCSPPVSLYSLGMAVQVRKGQGSVQLTREEFERRLRQRFYDPLFQNVDRQISEIVEVAWKAYDEYHKSPRTRKAGPGFA